MANRKLSLDDQSGLAEIIKLLPEKFVNDYVNDYLYNAYYPINYRKIINDYSEYKKEILSGFLNKKINGAYKEFNKAFDVLERFIVKHFYTPKSNLEGPMYHYLDPRIHHSFRSSYGREEKDESKDSEKWDKYKGELDSLAENFIKSYQKFLRTSKRELSPINKTSSDDEKIRLSGQKISFDDKKAIIKIGKISISLPPTKNEHQFCRVMFVTYKKPGIPTDWSEVYFEMTESNETSKKAMRSVYDTMLAINNRIKTEVRTSDDLFSWESKTIRRNY